MSVFDNYHFCACILDRIEFEFKVFLCFFRKSFEHIQHYFLPNILKIGKNQVLLKSQY